MKYDQSNYSQYKQLYNMNPFDITQFLKMFSNDKNLISTLLATTSLTYFAYIVFENFYVDYYWYIQLTGIITIGFFRSSGETQ